MGIGGWYSYFLCMFVRRRVHILFVSRVFHVTKENSQKKKTLTKKTIYYTPLYKVLKMTQSYLTTIIDIDEILAHNNDSTSAPTPQTISIIISIREMHQKYECVTN